MSPINFDVLISKYPESKRALRKLASWLNEHEDARTIYLRQLAREVPVDQMALADALSILVEAGVLRRVYKVTTPSGVLADAEFDDPREIPDKLPDRMEHYFDTAESDVVPVFKMVA